MLIDCANVDSVTLEFMLSIPFLNGYATATPIIELVTGKCVTMVTTH